ncbi:MAG: DUF6377 domain-containing protein [Chitinophagaceae bacterium]
MQRNLIAFILFWLAVNIGYTQSYTPKLMEALVSTMQKGTTINATKQHQVALLHQQLAAIPENLPAKYEVNFQLFNAYQLYHFDSAFYYASNLLNIGNKLNNRTYISQAQIQLGFILLSAGMFKEALEALAKVEPKNLNDSFKANYYALYGRYYYDLNDYNFNGIYTTVYLQKAAAYIDSALLYFPKNSFEYTYYIGLKNLKSGNLSKAHASFLFILNKIPSINQHQYALTTSTLSAFYKNANQTDTALYYLLKAAIADIESGTKETTATLLAANLFFEKGEIKNALICIQKANEDAQFYGSRQRKIQIGGILPLIEGEVLKATEKQKKQLLSYTFTLSACLLMVIVLVFLVLKQLKKIRKSNIALAEAHKTELAFNQLLKEANLLKEKMNVQLQQSNKQLQEANKIKEEYIGFFFHMDYQLLEKIAKLKATVEKKLVERKYDEARLVLQHFDVKQEKESLLNSFDKTFIKIFPAFIAEFNELFSPENKILLKEKECLNTELRIFALIRLGITDNEKIAQILDYSVNTIYTYKTKIRNKSTVSNEEFDVLISKIGSA